MKIKIPSRATAALVVICSSALCTLANASEVVVVAANSPVSAVTTDQLSQLFLGKIHTLPNGSGAVLIDQTEGSPARDDFYSKATGKSAAQIKALWSRLTFSGAAQPPKSAAGDAEVKKFVSTIPGAIGYIDKSAVDSSVKVVLTLD
jgi:ABC-type phosphate transport system substrate-binding protein